MTGKRTVLQDEVVRAAFAAQLGGNGDLMARARAVQAGHPVKGMSRLQARVMLRYGATPVAVLLRHRGGVR